MDRSLTCSAGVIVVAGMRVQIAPEHHRPSLLSALLLSIVVQALVVPPAHLDIFGSAAIRPQRDSSLSSVTAAGPPAKLRACNGRIRICWGRMMSTHAPHKVFLVRSLQFGVSFLRIAVWLAEPTRFGSDQPIAPPTPPPRLPA
jgi:hypothetical protein